MNISPYSQGMFAPLASSGLLGTGQSLPSTTNTTTASNDNISASSSGSTQLDQEMQMIEHLLSELMRVLAQQLKSSAKASGSADDDDDDDASGSPAASSGSGGGAPSSASGGQSAPQQQAAAPQAAPAPQPSPTIPTSHAEAKTPQAHATPSGWSTTAPSTSTASSAPTSGSSSSTSTAPATTSTSSASSAPATSSTATTSSGSSASAGNAAAGGINTTSTTGQREDVLIGSATDTANLANPNSALESNSRTGLYLTQISYTGSGNQQAIANAWQGKGVSIERADYASGYGSFSGGGLQQQFGQLSGKENMNTQTADLSTEDGAISDGAVSTFMQDLNTTRANGQNLLPVYGPNLGTGAGSFTEDFNSPNFDNFRKVASAAGGIVLDSPPSLMNNPQYTKWYQSATNWAHQNGVKVEWYASPADQSSESSSQYLSDVKTAVSNMNASGTNPDTYIFGSYVQSPAGTVASEEAAASWVEANTTPT